MAFLLYQSAHGALLQSASDRADRGGPGRRHHGHPPGGHPGRDRGRPGAGRVLPALRLVVVPGRRQRRALRRHRPSGARPGARRRRPGLADGGLDRRVRRGRELARAGRPADHRAAVLGVAWAARRADGRRRRGRAARRGDHRAGAPGAAIGLRVDARPEPDTPAIASARPSPATPGDLLIYIAGRALTRRTDHRRRAGRPARGPGGRPDRRQRGDHLQGPSGPLALGGRGRRHQRRAESRGHLGVARVRHDQGLGLPRRPGRDRDHVPRGARTRSCGSSTPA